MENVLSNVLYSVESELKSVERKIRYSAEKIEGKALDSIGFIDGSVVSEERRGAVFTAFSVASIVYDNNKYSLALPGSKRPIFHILIPKSYSESRSALLMRILELTEALRQVHSGVNTICMDGSYLTLLLTGYGYINELYTELRTAISTDEASAITDMLEKIGMQLIDDISKDLVELKTGIPSTVYGFFTSFLEKISAHIDAALKSIEEEFGRERIVPVLIDYISAYLELVPFFYISGLLLQKATIDGLNLVWISKESNSRFLAKLFGLRGWINDLVLIDSAWRGLENVYMVFEDATPVSKPRYPVAPRKLLDTVYRWNRYLIIYSKFSRFSPSLQLSFPKETPAEDSFGDILYTLSQISEKKTGYPKPLNYVHNLAVLNPEVARIVAEKIWRTSSGLQRSIMAPAGRVQVGLR